MHLPVLACINRGYQPADAGGFPAYEFLCGAGAAASVRLICQDMHGRRADLFLAPAASVKGQIRGLVQAVFGPAHHLAEERIDEFENRRDRSEIGGQLQPFQRLSLQAGFGNGIHIGFDIRSAKSIDGLLGVAHDEQAAGSSLKPIRVLAVHARVRQELDDLELHGIGILEFVHQQRDKALVEVAPNGSMPLQQIAGRH